MLPLNQFTIFRHQLFNKMHFCLRAIGHFDCIVLDCTDRLDRQIVLWMYELDLPYSLLLPEAMLLTIDLDFEVKKSIHHN